MKNHRIIPAVCAALAVSLLCTACGGQSSTDAGAASSQPELSVAEETSSAPETTAAESTAAPESSSEAETASAAESSEEADDRAEFTVTHSPATGVNHVLGSEDCDPQQFRPGDTVSGEIYNGYDYFANIENADGSSDEDAVLKFFPLSTSHTFMVYASDKPEDASAFPEMEAQWDYYDENYTEDMTLEEESALMPDPITISGRIEPMPEALEALFRDWFQNYFVDGDTYEEYCLRTVYIVSENG